MIETAKSDGLDSVQYLEDLLQKVSEMPTFAKKAGGLFARESHPRLKTISKSGVKE